MMDSLDTANCRAILESQSPHCTVYVAGPVDVAADDALVALGVEPKAGGGAGVVAIALDALDVGVLMGGSCENVPDGITNVAVPLADEDVASVDGVGTIDVFGVVIPDVPVIDVDGATATDVGARVGRAAALVETGADVF
jgi:hypothetical protein